MSDAATSVKTELVFDGFPAFWSELIRNRPDLQEVVAQNLFLPTTGRLASIRTVQGFAQIPGTAPNGVIGSGRRCIFGNIKRISEGLVAHDTATFEWVRHIPVMLDRYVVQPIAQRLGPVPAPDHHEATADYQRYHGDFCAEATEHHAPSSDGGAEVTDSELLSQIIQLRAAIRQGEKALRAKEAELTRRVAQQSGAAQA